MSSPDVIIDLIDAWPAGICDACLKDLTDADSHQYINATCRNLEMKGYIERQKNERVPCGHCKRVRVLNRRKQILQPTPTRPSSNDTTQSKPIDVDFMDRLRREVIQHLNKLDPASERTGFSRRVQDLRSRDLLTSTLSSLLLTHAAFRNAMYYQNFQPSETEKSILLAIDVHIRAHLKLHLPN